MAGVDGVPVGQLSPGEFEAALGRLFTVAAKIARQPPDVLRMTKRMMREGQNVGFDVVMEMSAAYQAIAHLTEDHQEAVNAFFEKRPGDFKGK